MYAGGIVGNYSAKKNFISNCYNTGNIVAYEFVGGIVGYSYNTANDVKIKIDNSYNTGSLVGSNIGGIIGAVAAMSADITDSHNIGKITAKGYRSASTGGIIGKIEGRKELYIDTCYNVGNIELNESGSYYIGGILGDSNYGETATIRNSYNEGNIDCNEKYNSTLYIGGVAGRFYGTTISQCYNSGEITISNNNDVYTGGIAGTCPTIVSIDNCYNNSSITVKDATYAYVGGITGEDYGSTYKCYNSGNLNCKSSDYAYIGGISGISKGSISFCYNTGDISAVPTKYCYIGGIVGNCEASISFVYNIGDIANNICTTVDGGIYIGGIAGRIYNASIANAYNTGGIKNYVNVSQTNNSYYIGGITGNSSSTVYTYNSGSIYNNITGHDISTDYIYTYAIGPNSNNNFYPNNIDIVGENIITTGTTASSDEYMRSKEFYNVLATVSEYWKYINGQYPILDIAIVANAPKVTDLTVENTKKQFDITTEIAKNNSGNRDGGTITGVYNDKYIDSNNKMYVETVKYGERNKEIIEVSPNEGYTIAEIKVNDKAIGFNADSNGKYIFEARSLEINENYHIVVTFEKQEELFIINKTNENGQCLEGATFRIESDSFDEISYDLIDNNEFYFYKSEDAYVPNNIGIKDTVANSYIKIDLRGLTGNYYVNLDAHLYGPGVIYATINQSTVAPDYNESSEYFLYTHSTGINKNYQSNLLEGGKLYNLHLGYFTDNIYTGTIAKFSNITITSEDGNQITKYITATTDENGQIKKALPMGTYKITEIEAPEGYMLDSEPREYTMESNKVNQINVLNRKLNNVIVHYYLDKTGEEYNKEPVIIQDDIELTGNIGTEYVSSPYINIGEYSLITDENEEYVIPDNASGRFEEETINVYYYYKAPEKDPPTGTYKLNVTKVNEKNPEEKVEGAEFEVYEVNGETETKVGTLTHKGNGLYESEEINITKEGTINVKLKETKVPDGYKAVQDITGTIKVELQEGEEEFKYVVTESSLGEITSTEDKKYGINFTIEEPEKDPLTGKYNLVVTKVNKENSNEKVPGAEFGVYEIDGETETKVGTLTDSNNDGIYESGDLAITEVGTKNITIKETKVPTGFAKIADKTGTITFEKSTEKEEYIVKESSFGTVENGNITFTIEEPTLKGTYSLEITKVDTEGNKVSGAEFTVYDGTTEIAKLIDNNNDGIYESGNIGISNKGTISITIEETIIPKGYIKANDITGTITFEKSTNKEEYIVTGSTLGNVSEDGLKISLEIIEEKQKDEKYDLAIKKFVSAIDGKKITTREPKVEISEDGTITYSQNNKIEQVANNQEVTYTIRTYNESNVTGKGKRAIEYIPDGLVFLPKNQKNIDNGWVMYIVNEDGTWTRTDDPEKAKIVVTDCLVNKEIPAVDGKKVSHEDVEAIFKVDETKLTSKDRIIENIVEINTKDNSKPGENPGEKPGDNDNPNDDPEDNPTNNKTSEKLYVKYFDLSMKKYIKQVVVTDDKKSETIDVAKENQKDVKIEVNKSKANKTTLTITYVLEVKNVGQIEGNSDKISEYIPEEFKLEDSKAIWKIDGNIATTESLKEFVIKPGETKEIEVVCTWKLSENTSGVRSNEAKIEEYSNRYDAKDPTEDNKDSSDIEVIIINDKYDLAIKKFISAIDNEEITTRIPKVEISEDGKITYTQNSEIEKVANSQEVTYTLRMYNESDIKGKGKRVIEYIPDGLVFLPENETNKKYNWVMFKADENGQLERTENTEEATIVVTDYLVDKEINAFNKGTDTGLSYLDVQAVFKVDETKLTSKDRIIENKVQIMPNENDDYPGNDESTEKVYVKYFDLSIEKYIDEVKVNTNGNEKIVKVGYDKKDELVKIDVKRSEVDKTKLTVTYGLLVKNVGEIAGYVAEIKDYIPKDFTIVNSESWKLEGNEAINTELEDMILEPGESTIVNIKCEWNLSEGSIGERYNEAEISKYKNEYDAIDITDDNKDKEGLLVTLKTGSEIIAYSSIAVAFIVIITIGTYFIKRKAMQ